MLIVSPTKFALFFFLLAEDCKQMGKKKSQKTSDHSLLTFPFPLTEKNQPFFQQTILCFFLYSNLQFMISCHCPLKVFADNWKS